MSVRVFIEYCTIIELKPLKKISKTRVKECASIKNGIGYVVKCASFCRREACRISEI